MYLMAPGFMLRVLSSAFHFILAFRRVTVIKFVSSKHAVLSPLGKKAFAINVFQGKENNIIKFNYYQNIWKVVTEQGLISHILVKKGLRCHFDKALVEKER